MRSRRDRKLGGVAGGVAQYFGWDPTLVRVAWVAAVFLSVGAAVIAYVLLWLLAPEEA